MRERSMKIRKKEWGALVHIAYTIPREVARWVVRPLHHWRRLNRSLSNIIDINIFAYPPRVSYSHVAPRARIHWNLFIETIIPTQHTLAHTIVHYHIYLFSSI